MLAIYKRELRAYFVTPIGYVCLAIFLAASGFLFSLTTLQSQTTDIGSYFTFSLFLLINTSNGFISSFPSQPFVCFTV